MVKHHDQGSLESWLWLRSLVARGQHSPWNRKLTVHICIREHGAERTAWKLVGPLRSQRTPDVIVLQQLSKATLPNSPSTHTHTTYHQLRTECAPMPMEAFLIQATAMRGRNSCWRLCELSLSVVSHMVRADRKFHLKQTGCNPERPVVNDTSQPVMPHTVQGFCSLS